MNHPASYSTNHHSCSHHFRKHHCRCRHHHHSQPGIESKNNEIIINLKFDKTSYHWLQHLQHNGSHARPNNYKFSYIKELKFLSTSQKIKNKKMTGNPSKGRSFHVLTLVRQTPDPCKVLPLHGSGKTLVLLAGEALRICLHSRKFGHYTWWECYQDQNPYHSSQPPLGVKGLSFYQLSWGFTGNTINITVQISTK